MDIPHFCHTSQSSVSSNFHPSALEFLTALDLPTIHPHCLADANHNNITHSFLSVTETLPLQSHEYPNSSYHHHEDADNHWMSQYLTLWFQIAPAFLALTELWFRLIAFYMAPISICLILLLHRKSKASSSSMAKRKEDVIYLVLVVTSTISSMILLVDSLYVYTYGRILGIFLFLTSVSVSIQGIRNKMKFYQRHSLIWITFMICLTIYLWIHSYPTRTDYHRDHPGLDIPTIKEGLYYSHSNSFISSIVQHWPEHTRTYNIFHGATPYLPNGDSLTGIPFLVNSSPHISYERRWVINREDFEAVAIDIAFPSNGIHNTTKPLYLILHGLNGGSHEEYVRDFVSRSTNDGSTCIVMIARGLMDTPVRGWNVFHGARTTDIEAVAQDIRTSIGKHQLLVGVGFSMGAIVLSNYVAKSGVHCKLDAAMAVSGGLDMRENLNFRRSMRLWQPLLAKGLRDDFIVNKFHHLFKQRLTKEQNMQLMRASSITVSDGSFPLGILIFLCNTRNSKNITF